MKWIRSAATLLLLCLSTAAYASGDQHQREIEEVRNEIVESLGYPPIFVTDSTKIIRVERHWSDEIRVHLDNGHTLRVTVELDSY